MELKRASRSLSKIKLAITGPSGSGKSYSALRLATGIGGPIAAIDTENGSLSLYSDKFQFDVIDLNPPYSVDKYLEAINLIVKNNYNVLLIDSVSHAWAGEGGILREKEQLDARGGNSWTNWAKFTPLQERFMAGLLHSPIHTVVTMRSKQEYDVQKDSNGRTSIQKVGLAPIQREGMEYEFTTVFDVAMNHTAQVSKDRTGLFTDKIFKITEDTGEQISKWLSGKSGEQIIGPDKLSTGDYFMGNLNMSKAPVVTAQPKEQQLVDTIIKRLMDLGDPLLAKKAIEDAGKSLNLPLKGSADIKKLNTEDLIRLSQVLE